MDSSRAPADPRVALVTGGSGGIGSAICRRLTTTGHVVAVADLDEEGAGRVADQIGGLAVELDVTDPSSVTRAVRQTTAELGPVTVCVNAAGWDELRPFLSTDEAFSAMVIEINLSGPIRVVRAVLPAMVRAGWGRIINVASDAGRVGSSLEAVYSGAKGGLISFTKTIAREFARYGVTANTVSPGPTDTPLLAGIVEATEDSQRIIDSIVRTIPMRRLGSPDDVAPAVSFLASDEAGFITGQTLSVSGGLTMA